MTRIRISTHCPAPRTLVVVRVGSGFMLAVRLGPDACDGGGLVTPNPQGVCYWGSQALESISSQDPRFESRFELCEEPRASGKLGF